MQIIHKVILFFLLSLSPHLHSTQIHALIAADTITNIKHSSKHDLNNMRQILDTISVAIGAPLHTHELTAKKLALEPLEKWLRGVHSTPDDIVFFYFTGHGLRSKKSATMWPALYFVHSGKLIDMNAIVEKVKKVPARLYVIISDCCNNMRKKARIFFPKDLLPEQPAPDAPRAAYRKLFLETQGIIIASGAVPGELAWASDQGGIFTNALLESLRHEVSNESEPHWHHIFERSGSLCNSLQKPQYLIHITSVQK